MAMAVVVMEMAAVGTAMVAAVALEAHLQAARAEEVEGPVEEVTAAGMKAAEATAEVAMVLDSLGAVAQAVVATEEVVMASEAEEPVAAGWVLAESEEVD